MLRWIIPALALMAATCGTNTEEPVFPILTSFSTVAPPAIVSVAAVENTDETPARYEFDVSYYITNQEDGFLGYNLYVNSSTSAAEGTFAPVSGDPYLPDGTRPSFKHAGSVASTASADLITRRVDNFKAAPAPENFQLCELYYFRLTALVRNGLESSGSVEVSKCAALDTALCPVGSACNPGT
ncbi:MAG: hypothetical protein KDK34_11980 [Leptospiraceae bacterium]|nr:hypothetical protein [Leptospiraceae bacterium]